MAGNSMMRFEIPLARIYGRTGKVGTNVYFYLDLIQKEPETSANIIREFDRYILEDATNEANIALKKALLQRLQQDQGVVYNEILSWFFHSAEGI